MEIKRGFLNYLILMYNRLVQTDNWSDFSQYISNLSSSPRRYHLGAIIDALTKFWETIEKQRPSELAERHGEIDLSEILKRDTLSFLRYWIRFLLVKIDKSVDDVLNPMECFVDLDSPQIKKGVFVSKPNKCPDSSVECQIKGYFNDNADDFKKILNKLKSIPSESIDNETTKRISSLKKIIKKHLIQNHHFSNYSQREKLCWDCSDAIHAVLAPKGSLVVNRNEKHFKPICEAIDKEYVTYSSPK